MTNEFKILWFEDEVSWFNMESLRIKRVLAQHYLKPIIDRKAHLDFDISTINDNSYDLIIMDFKLVSEPHGDKIIILIRENQVLTDILFYSSEEEKMIEAIYSTKTPVDGIYYTKRDYEVFTQKAEGLINKIIKRSEDLINLRGFVLDSSSDFEVRIKEILYICWHKFNDDEKLTIEQSLIKEINRTKEWVEKNVVKMLDQCPVFPIANSDNHFLNHSQRLYLLDKTLVILISKYGMQSKEDFKKFKQFYTSEISEYRNALGHRKCQESSILIRNESIPVDEVLHQRMRVNISKFEMLIQDIESFITEQI